VIYIFDLNGEDTVVFIRYTPETKGYKIFFPYTKTFEVSWNVVFFRDNENSEIKPELI